MRSKKDANFSKDRLFTIDTLNPYQNKWTVRVRVTAKQPVRTWSNSRGEGRLFSFDIVDQSGEMRVTAFNDVCDNFFSTLEVGKVYYMSKGTIKPANRQYTSIANDYEMTLNHDSIIEPCEDCEDDIPSAQYNFVHIKSLADKQVNTMVDVLAVIKSVTDTQVLTIRQSSKEISKRELILVDKSESQITCAIWGVQAEEFEFSGPVTVAIKGARIYQSGTLIDSFLQQVPFYQLNFTRSTDVNDFQGRSLSLLQSSSMTLSPKIPEAIELMSWYESGGQYLDEIFDLSTIRADTGQNSGGAKGDNQLKTFSDLQLEKLMASQPAVAYGEEAAYITMKAIIVGVRKDNCVYQSCPTPKCNKKLIAMDMGQYRCEKCNKDVTDFTWRFMLQINLADFTGSHWVTCFNEHAETLIGIDANQFGSMKASGDDTSCDEAFFNMNFTEFIFRIRAKMERYNDENRLRLTCVGVNPLKHAEYGRRLLEAINKATLE
ncbi:hypothetical protein ACOME3_009265 [Neoechinorhynchus agilis]